MWRGAKMKPNDREDEMNLRLIPASVVALVLSLLLPSLSKPQALDVAGRPRVLEVSSVAPEKNAQMSSLIAEIRSEADAFVILSGGASRMSEDHQRQLRAMFEALSLVAKGGRRIAVGDGGTQAGIMEAAGHARRKSGRKGRANGARTAAGAVPNSAYDGGSTGPS
jgi:hypothetical protein